MVLVNIIALCEKDRLYEYAQFDVSAGPGAHIHRADTLHSRTVLIGRSGKQVTARITGVWEFIKLAMFSHGVGAQVRSRT